MRFIESLGSLFWFYSPQMYCFDTVSLRKLFLVKKLWKTHRVLPTGHQNADRQIWQLAGEHIGALADILLSI